ncbi:MAG: ActS/PrrB/RegB family redox-sensitive histidine kinase, partial [Alphaproteobacteria bacterium]|nr:ActS/PrrB/RegB family redox-sensitive histidine kinase [Alphaproteobacteria bacterium]MBV9418880.1 ActS/PrrB/RegB family redox-sensitive histidine kinase [Alphaproteobacteria bacterium]
MADTAAAEGSRLRIFTSAPTGAARGRVRLRTLSNLRWMAVGGQSAAIFIVYFGFGYALPLLISGGLIAASIVLNIVLALRYPASHRLTNREATVYLGFDVAQLAALLYLTGGITNPFALMFLAPVVIAAATLNLGNTLILAALAFASVCLISVFHEPLPWPPGERLELPTLYQAGIWASLVIGIGFTSVYAWRIASEGARMSAGLAATQLALSREHRLAALGALATAAAHELGTPLGTIAVVARELERSLPQGSTEMADAQLLREQAERCRAILARLANPEEALLGETARLTLGAFLENLVEPYRGEDLDITITLRPEVGGDAPPQVWRAPELVHGLQNIIENAADFAQSHVRVLAQWNASKLSISVEDDGPGFAPEIFERIGEPYITSRPGHFALGETELGPTTSLDKHEGMGLGFFIAKT